MTELLFTLTAFFFVIICPVVTIIGLILFAVPGKTVREKVIWRMTGITILTLMMGPMEASFASVPWWMSRDSAFNHSFVGVYVLVCTLIYMVVSWQDIFPKQSSINKETL